MPPFDNAPSFYKISTLSRWYDAAVPELHDPELLWDVYWRRFNTVPIPILPYEEYFEKALEIAKLAKDKEHFERMFEEKNSQSWEELQGFMLDAGYQTVYHKDIFPCEDARRKVDTVCRHGCLMDFIRLLKGSAFGWEADEVCETHVDHVPRGEEALVGTDAHLDTEYTDQGEVFEPEMLDWEELVAKSRAYKKAMNVHGTSTASEPASRKAADAALRTDRDKSPMHQGPAPSRTSSNSEADGLKEAQQPQRKGKRARFSDGMIHAPEPDRSFVPRSANDGSISGEPSSLTSENDRGYKRQKLDGSTTLSHANTPSPTKETISKKRPICDDDGSGGEQRHKRQRLNSSSQQHAAAETNAPRINKRPLYDGDNDDADNDNDNDDKQGHKRQKLDSSSQVHAHAYLDGSRTDKSRSQKRPLRDNDNVNDENDDDDDEQRHKRQRLDSSSQQPAEADSTESGSSSKQRSRRSRRKGDNANRAPGNVKTRSLNRIRPSTFWALDPAGKASIRIR